MKATPRGIRNNNPFNLEITSNDKWQGLSPVQPDPKFWTFSSAVYGIRAGMRDLIAAQDKHGRRTVRSIITPFAPASENDTEAYIATVKGYMGVSDSEFIDMHTYTDLRSMSEAIIGHENGGRWSDWYTDAQMTKACVMAGVEPPKRGLIKSGQIIGGAVAATATVAAPVVQTVQDQLQPLTDYSDVLKHVFLVVALLGIVLTVGAKYNERKKGIS